MQLPEAELVDLVTAADIRVCCRHGHRYFGRAGIAPHPQLSWDTIFPLAPTHVPRHAFCLTVMSLTPGRRGVEGARNTEAAS